MTSLRDYRRETRLREMDRRQDTERMVSEFTMGGACWMCGYNGSPGWLHDENEEKVERCPICNVKEK